MSDEKKKLDPFKRKQVEAICRAVCEVEGIDPDESPFDIDIGSDPNWTRYADAVAAVVCGEQTPPKAWVEAKEEIDAGWPVKETP